MPYSTSNRSSGSSGYTGGSHSQPSSGALDRWASARDDSERFYVSGTNTDRGYFKSAGMVADWEHKFSQAGESSSRRS